MVCDADAKDNKRLCYVGQDLFLSGKGLGERIVDLVPEGEVVGFIATPGQLNIQPRLDGAAAAIKESGKQDKSNGDSERTHPERGGLPVRPFLRGIWTLRACLLWTRAAPQRLGRR